MKRKHLLYIMILLAVALLVRIFAERTETVQANGDLSECLSVTFFNTGKADCILATYQDFVILIDTATEEYGPQIEQWLKERGIETVNYLILSHLDGDHMGSAKYLLQHFKIDKIIQPQYEKDTNGYRAYVQYLKEQNRTPVYGTADMDFELSDLKLHIWSPKEKKYEKSNDYSLIVTLELGENKLMFCGDAEELRLAELENYPLEHYKLIKTPHHGQYTKSLATLVHKIEPDIAVFTREDPYVTQKRTIRLYSLIKTQMYWTGSGNIQVYCNQKDLWLTQ